MNLTAEILADRYRLGRLLGQGGMSDVYEATDERTGLAVAIKIVRSGTPDLGRRLAQEARALERLHHPGLVRLVDTGFAGSQAYLVMELIVGPTLAESMRLGPFGPERTARLGAGLADALTYVHDRGIVHRDVKPSNILMTAEGRARLGDFGVARLLDASTLTATGTTVGTAAYMAPEQLEDHQVGSSADIWSLGIVLLECLTGRRIYEGSPSEVVARRLAGPVPLPADLPVAWRLLLSGMLDHRPDQRLAGAEVAALLGTSPFRAPWEPSGVAEMNRPASTVSHDLTALVLGAATTAVLAGSDTDVYRPAASIDSRTASKAGRQWKVVAVATVVTAGLVVGLLLALGTRPTSHRPAASNRPTTLSPATPTTTSTTPTTLAAGPAALAVLQRDLASGVAAGSVDAGTSQSVTNQAEQAVTDQASGKANQAASNLRLAAATIAGAIQSGRIAQDEGATLQADLSTLAAAIGLSGLGAPATTQPGEGQGHGKGNGN